MSVHFLYIGVQFLYIGCTKFSMSCTKNSIENNRIENRNRRGEISPYGRYFSPMVDEWGKLWYYISRMEGL